MTYLQNYDRLRHDVFFFNDTATTEIYTLSLHDALPISPASVCRRSPRSRTSRGRSRAPMSRSSPTAASAIRGTDRKSTRLNSSHANISYAVFCLKKKNHNPLPLHISPSLSISPHHISLS